MNLYRQGDILFIEMPQNEAEAIVKGATLVPREEGRIVLAHGEATGHSHVVVHNAAKLYEIETGAERRILITPIPVRVYHEEHAAIALPAGAYRVIRQREYQPDQIRRVLD